MRDGLRRSHRAADRPAASACRSHKPTRVKHVVEVVRPPPPQTRCDDPAVSRIAATMSSRGQARATWASSLAEIRRAARANRPDRCDRRRPEVVCDSTRRRRSRGALVACTRAASAISSTMPRVDVRRDEPARARTAEECSRRAWPSAAACRSSNAGLDRGGGDREVDEGQVVEVRLRLVHVARLGGRLQPWQASVAHWQPMQLAPADASAAFAFVIRLVSLPVEKQHADHRRRRCS